ncbi:unnamed protein product [Lactuca virosa]|uniref:Uncharacterized protein n=1 Tax=Lactuca virosa TaxID=75947 RepID=A0AAU9PT79_9ASTR|nr:unnamed protein product [Lactuca virosa]
MVSIQKRKLTLVKCYRLNSTKVHLHQQRIHKYPLRVTRGTRGGARRKAKEVVDEVFVVKPTKRQKLKMKVKPSIVDEEMEDDVDEKTNSDVLVEPDVKNEEDIVRSSEHIPKSTKRQINVLIPTPIMNLNASQGPHVSTIPNPTTTQIPTTT